MKTLLRLQKRCAFLGIVLTGIGLVQASSYQIIVSNERSGDISIIDGNHWKVVASIPVGKRPRGIIASPDGHTVYVALSGTPISGPPPLDAKGNPILHKGKGDDDDRSEERRVGKECRSRW